VSLVLYGLKNCDTCKKALGALKGAGHNVSFVDIRAEADLADKVPAWLKAAGPDKLINRRSTTWRQLSDAQKVAAGSGDAAELLIDHPTLIKRPVVEHGADVFVGWDKAVSGALG
jgi:Spx/MgsR family transcriptional regulator